MHHTRTRTHATATRRGRSLCVDDGVRAGRPRDIVMSEFSWSTSCEGSSSLLEHSAKSQRDSGQGLPPQARPLGRSNSQTLHQSIRSFMCGCWFRSNDRSSLTATRTGTHNGYDKPECKGDESKSPVSMGTCQTLPGSSPSVRQRWLRRVCFEPLPQSCLYTFMYVDFVASRKARAELSPVTKLAVCTWSRIHCVYYTMFHVRLHYFVHMIAFDWSNLPCLPRATT